MRWLLVAVLITSSEIFFWRLAALSISDQHKDSCATTIMRLIRIEGLERRLNCNFTITYIVDRSSQQAMVLVVV